MGYQTTRGESSVCKSAGKVCPEMGRFAGQCGKKPTASTLADLNRGPATDGIETGTARGTANGTGTVTATAVVLPTETANAIKTETGTTIVRGIETVTIGLSAVTAATVTIGGTATVTTRETANGTRKTGGRNGLATILTTVDRMRKDVKTTHSRMGLPADAGLNLNLRGEIARGTLVGAEGTTMTTDAEMIDRRDALLPLLPLGETCPLANPLGFIF